MEWTVIVPSGYELIVNDGTVNPYPKELQIDFLDAAEKVIAFKLIYPICWVARED